MTDKMSLFSLIRLHSNQFTAAQEKIVNFLQNNAQQALKLPINEFAQKCRVGEATVVRFYRTLGYDNYSMFRVALGQELKEQEIQPIYEEIEANNTTNEVVRKVIDSTTQSISDLAKHISLDMLEVIESKFLAASVVHVVGMGASGVVAQDVMHKMMRLGIKINCYSDPHMMTIAASVAREDEVFFAICHSGETVDVLNLIKLAKSRGCFTCCITSYIGSTITELADAYLLSCARDTKMRSDAMISRIIQLVVIDILYVKISMRIGDNALTMVNETRLALQHYRNKK